MLLSSSEYLKALREGKYLLFLEWPRFVAKYYKVDDAQDAVELIHLLVFDWLNNGFCERDIKLIALLYRVYSHDSRPLRGELAYALTSISIAAFECMVYQSTNLQQQCLSSDKLNSLQINQLLNKSSERLGEAAFKTQLKEQQTQFYQWVKDAPSKQVEASFNSIYSVTYLRYCVEDYCATLSATEIPDDRLRSSRISVINRLFNYLNEQSELTASVSDEIAVYVKKIREMQPAEFEEQYLDSLVPLSLVDSSWQLIAGVGMRFFDLLSLTPSQPVISKEEGHEVKEPSAPSK